MKKLALFATLFAVVTAFAGNFEAECQKVEKWIAEKFAETTPSFRLQHNILRRIRNTKGSDEEKIAALHSKFPKAFGEGWKSELAAAKQQGITFSSDNKTLLKCPKNVTSVVIPSCVTTIGEEAFYRCKNLTGVTIPDGVTTIGNWAFGLCYNLTSVTIPNSVTTIGKGAFWGCEKLTSVTIPNSVTTIGEGAFCRVSKVQVSSDNTVFMVDDYGALLDMKNNRLLYLPGGFRGKYIVPEGITTIGEGAFWGCKNLTGITIPDSVTTIGKNAFCLCEKLTSVTIPNSVTIIGDEAFCLCKNLIGVTIPNSVTTIGEGAFSWCKNLTSVTIPNSVTTIGNDTFYECKKLTSITIPRRCEVGKDAFPKNCKVIRR